MRVTVQDDRGFVVADYSTETGHRCVGPRFATQNAIAIAALAETISFLSPDIESQAVCLAVEAMPSSPPAH